MMLISSQRISDVIKAYQDALTELRRLHMEGVRPGECTNWMECDCRLADQIRTLQHIEEEWQTRGDMA
jgi:hypothetical protein